MPVAAAPGWENVTAGEGAAAHLCPKCTRLRERGELASNPLDWRCIRCGRTPADGLDDWRIGHDADGARFTTCVECFNEDEDSLVI